MEQSETNKFFNELRLLADHIEGLGRQNKHLYQISQQLKASNIELMAWGHIVLSRLDRAGMKNLQQEMEDQFNQIILKDADAITKIRKDINGTSSPE